MKYLLLIIVLLMGCTSVLGGVSRPIMREPPTPETLDEYYASIDYSCQTDADCEIKDVHNCCGYYPECVNADARTDADLVGELCQNEGMASICGFPSIDACRCSEGRCEGY